MDILADGHRFAIALSGGSDSMALALLAANWAKTRDVEVITLTVDHRLRAESAHEAKWVGTQMSARGIRHEILTYKGRLPTKNIEAAAREYRYKLLCDWCRANAVDALLVAHNSDEQAETFLMNLSRGSGVSGLAAMSERAGIGGIPVLRPLLEFKKADLQRFLRTKHQEWIEDPMNRDERFKRVRMRGLLKRLELSPERIALTVENMARAKEALEFYADELLAAPLTVERLKSAPEDTALRALAKVLIGKYHPRLSSLKT
ncbi:MAG: tRNA lysidine(34) synthetase TilS, partial [Rickettsiales bacterium]|nr:tRNA lysidine(34) synthetase TilS [Rickettsiales bacterium]